MCKSDKKIEVVEKSQEVEESTGFHFLEIHAPTAGMSFFAFFTFAIIGTLLFLCYRRYRRRRHSQRQQQQQAANINDSFQLQQQQQQQLWNHIPWNQAQPIIYTPRIQPLDEPEQAPIMPRHQRQAPLRQPPQQRLNRLPPPAEVAQQPEDAQLPPGV
jgi:flagellar biosynthesis component FlhA